MAKQIKCKKCNLTYDKKKYECPYCHKKRFNPTGLIIFIIILAVAAGALFYFKGNDIINSLKEIKNKTEFEYENITYTAKNIAIRKNNDNTKLEITIEAKNNNKNEYTFDCSLSIYEDEYLNKNWYSTGGLSTSRIIESLQPNTKLLKEITIELNNDWNELIIYGEFENETLEMFKIYNTTNITQIK